MRGVFSAGGVILLANVAAWSAYAQALPASGPATVIGATVGESATLIVGPALSGSGGAMRRTRLMIDNESPSAAIACTIDGSTPALNTGGSFTLAAGATRIWDSGFVPNGAVNCIAGSTGVPVTVEADAQ